MITYRIPDSDIVFLCVGNKIIGKIDTCNDVKRLTYEDIINNPSIAFMMDKHEEYLYFSHKQNIIAEIYDMNNDILSYILDF